MSELEHNTTEGMPEVAKNSTGWDVSLNIHTGILGTLAHVSPPSKAMQAVINSNNDALKQLLSSMD